MVHDASCAETSATSLSSFTSENQLEDDNRCETTPKVQMDTLFVSLPDTPLKPPSKKSKLRVKLRVKSPTKY